MKNKAIILVLGLGLAICGSQTAQAQELVIDNFISDQRTQVRLVNGRQIIRRSGTDIIGGVREADFGVTPLPDANGIERATLLYNARNRGPLFLESGVKSAFGLNLFYGNDINGNANPLNLPLWLLGYRRFLIEFGSCDVELNYLIQVFDGDGDNAILSGTESTADRVDSFNVYFPFEDFAPGGPGPINWDDIDAIIVQFQTGNATGSADFAVNRVVALPPQQ